ncbi:hypothetical protein MRB53_028764 [Persea americana]|uniref:Uncharacterized protein n=1 Tax=Persea americana TaxID=3435 RepID=A0ACC2KGG2_PERAE|nr:hypothetical protein MRB53_028764 [Persea americana]
MTVREEEDGHGLLDMRKKKHRTHVSSDMRKTTGNMRTLFNFFYANHNSSNEMNGWASIQSSRQLASRRVTQCNSTKSLQDAILDLSYCSGNLSGIRKSK